MNERVGYVSGSSTLATVCGCCFTIIAGESMATFSQLEKQILDLIAECCTYEEIAQELGVSVKVASKYIAKVGRMLGLEKHVHLVRYAMVRKLYEVGLGKVAIIYEVWGCRSGGSERYRQAEAEYELIVSALA